MTLAVRLLRFLPVLVLIAIIAMVLGARLLGPHDLYEKDQPKTMAYTADIVLNHRFSLPRDVIYQPATKPPLYNWIGAAAVEITGRWDEWVLKLPSLLGALATGAIVAFMAARRSGNDRWTIAVDVAPPLLLGCLAAAVWFTFGSDIRHGSVIRMAYLGRPDMLQCAWLTGAWALATIAVARPNVRAALNPAIGFWLCVTAAALTKGPAAAMPIVFAVLLAFLTPSITPRWRNLLKLWPLVGVPILIAGVGTWLAFAYHQDPQHVKSVIFGAEIAGRVIDKSPEGISKPIYYSAMWFVTKAQPWGLVAVFALFLMALEPHFRRRWFSAGLYLVVVIACLSLPAGKRMDYLLPAYPPAALLVTGVMTEMLRRRWLWLGGLAYALITFAPTAGAAKSLHFGGEFLLALGIVAVLAIFSRRLHRIAGLLPIVPLGLAYVLAHRHLTEFHEAKEHWSDHAVAFVRAIRSQPQTRDVTIDVIVRGKHPLTTLLGQHPGSYLTRADLGNAEYVIAPLQPDWQPILTSEPLPIGFETLETRKLAPLGLYHFDRGTAPVDRLVELQKQVGTWTAEENPYHEPGTVYRD